MKFSNPWTFALVSAGPAMFAAVQGGYMSFVGGIAQLYIGSSNYLGRQVQTPCWLMAVSSLGEIAG